MNDSAPEPARAVPSWLVAATLTCFFVGGLTSLVLETAWSKSLSYLLGTDLYGAATTIIAYMAGLGVGALLAVRFAGKLGPPLRAYALLQVGIGVAGLLSISLLHATEGLFEALYRLSSQHTLFLGARFLVTFLVLLPATTLMGMTLPVVVGAHGLARLSTPATVGLLYGLNTLGAVTGTVLAGFVLVPRVGLHMTCIVAGVLDLVIALGAYLLHRKLLCQRQPQPSAPPAEVATAQPAVPFDAGVAGAVFFSGLMALALELCWFRLLGQVIGPTVQAFALTLAVFLAGVGLGSLFGSRLLRRFATGEAALLFFLVAGALLALIPAYYLDDVPALYTSLWQHKREDMPEASLVVAQVLTACALMLPATLMTGAAFPAGVRAYRERQGERESLPSISGKLFFVNTLGSAIGTFVWAFFLVPDFGVDGGIRLGASMALVGAVLVIVTPPAARARAAWKRTQAVTAAALALCVVVVLLVPAPDARALNQGVFSTIRSTNKRNSWLAQPMSDKAKIVFSKDGVNGSVSVVANRHGSGGLDLAFSGKWVASTHLSTRRSLILLGHLPMLLSERAPESALVIGLGTGITSGSLLQYPSLKSLTIVEIERAVLEASNEFRAFNHSPLEDPRTKVVIQDGRTYVAFTDQTFDLITSDPIHPWVKGAANLYTREYYARAVERLNPGGIFCQWIPSTMSVGAFRSILKTIHSAFPHVQFLFADREVVAVAALEPIRYDEAKLAERMAAPAVSRDLNALRVGEVDKMMQLLERDLHPIERTRYQGARLNTDDNVLLEHLLPWDTFHGHVVQLRPNASSKAQAKPAVPTRVRPVPTSAPTAGPSSAATVNAR